MENNSPLYDDDSDEEKTNSTPMIKAIMEKVIDKYEIFSPASESDMSESLRKVYCNICSCSTTVDFGNT